MEAAEMEEVIYLESSIPDFSTNRFDLIDNVGNSRMKAHYSLVCGIRSVDSGELYTTCLRTTNLAKLKFVGKFSFIPVKEMYDAQFPENVIGSAHKRQTSHLSVREPQSLLLDFSHDILSPHPSLCKIPIA
ncbi:hypothetical protein AVEN_113426-1 [Araneus ventricosus]|uniref:Uncharacterized protein n=1 Tax=Araneus ventricosus TaxID=182803 RepID=A0A4Y2K7B3_ARAVE|nr:hypothetical protein AVEN_113426-1 [Araneus ventricosus]